MNNFDVVALILIEVVDVGGVDLGFEDGGGAGGLSVAPVVPQDNVIALDDCSGTMRR